MTSHPDIAEMYYTACKFSDCADFCMREQHERTALRSFYTDPGIVNAAFSCEVFLKLLLHLEQMDCRKSHKLKQLFELLPLETKETIKRQTIHKCGYWNDIWGQEVLSQVSDAFVKWRYVYENDWSKSAVVRCDIGYLLAFKDALRVACEKKLGIKEMM